jgi:flavin reductase (DIM6/NTAB) family NADH-FMN oxidoreductase RutF
MEKIKMGPQTWLYPMPAILVGVVLDEKPNFMTAAWCGIAGSSPPAVSVALRKVRYTFEGIQAQEAFSINIPSADLVKKVDYCGIYSGRKRDKSQMFQVEYGSLKAAPLIKECPVSLECKVIHTLDLNSHVLFIGEIKETYVKAECLTDGKPNPAKIDPLIYATGTDQYFRLGDIIGPAFSMGKDQK